MCFSLGLKKPGDFTMSEGHGYPLVILMIIIMKSHKLKVKLGLPPTMKVKIISHPIEGRSFQRKQSSNTFDQFATLNL